MGLIKSRFGFRHNVKLSDGIEEDIIEKSGTFLNLLIKRTDKFNTSKATEKIYKMRDGKSVRMFKRFWKDTEKFLIIVHYTYESM